MKTTIIIGAGANKEINRSIGLGADLIQDISDRVTDRTVPAEYAYLSKMLDEDFGFDKEIREKFLIHLDRFKGEVESASIDAFLDEIAHFPEFQNLRDDFTKIGRLLIVAHVLGYEGADTKRLILEDIKLKNSWFAYLADYIESKNLFKTTELQIITFNYDRILEYYLIQRFSSKIKSFISSNIQHVYGRLGYFDGIDALPDEEKIDFGHNNTLLRDISADKLKEQIKLIHDRGNTHSIKRDLKESHKLIIFGYGFDPINNKRLGLHDWKGLQQKGEEYEVYFNIYPGTIPNYDFRSRRLATSRIRDLFVDAEIHYKSCNEFLRHCLK